MKKFSTLHADIYLLYIRLLSSCSVEQKRRIILENWEEPGNEAITAVC